MTKLLIGKPTPPRFEPRTNAAHKGSFLAKGRSSMKGANVSAAIKLGTKRLSSTLIASMRKVAKRKTHTTQLKSDRDSVSQVS